MKKTILSILMICAAITTYGQSFNYQAIVKDAAGDPVVNQAIGVQVTLARSGANIFQETHSVTSNDNGLIALAIGTGTPTLSTFAAIDWSTQDFVMDIAVDITGGTTYASIGVTTLRQVPYALYAASAATAIPNGGNNGQVLSTDGSGVYSWVDQTAMPNVTFATTANVTSNANGTIATDDFVFGSTQLDDITGSTDDDHRLFFNKSKGAFRAGKSFQTSWDDVNVGIYSVSIGNQNIASGGQSTAFGGFNLASGPNTLAVGFGNGATANNSVAIGQSLRAESRNQISLGLNNTLEPAGNANTWVNTDRLLVIGNGFGTRSDALVMLKNGNTTLNGSLTIDGDNAGAGTPYTLPAQDGNANQIMSTDGSGAVSWIDAPSGGGTTLPSGGTNGQVLATDGSGVYSWVDQTAMSNVTFATTANVTSNANGTIATDDFVFGSTQLANDTGTTNDDNRVFFDKSKAAFRAGSVTGNEWDDANVGLYSIGLGQNAEPRANNAIAIGTSVEALGNGSIGLGNQTVSTGTNSIVIGNTSVALSRDQITLGTWNSRDIFGDPDNWVPDDRLLVVGNGTGSTALSNALVMLKNGNTTIHGTFTVDADNIGGSSGYTLPAQDGSTNQVMGTNGSGIVSWINVPADGDGDSTNEIELPIGGTNGQVLSTNGSGVYSWVNNAMGISAFSTTTNVTSNAPGAIATDDFVFGSTQLANVTGTTNDDSRMFFDKSKSAFRAGYAFGDKWDDSNVGINSIALGLNSGATELNTVAIGTSVNANRLGAVAIGYDSGVAGEYGVSLGSGNISFAKNEVIIGSYASFDVSASTDTWVSTERLFVIGNGTSLGSRSSALVMLKNGNTTLNGSLTIDGDNAGAGTSYTLPAQDGTANQVMSTNGSGAVSWINTPSDGDNDPTNEIELPVGGSNGQVLSTDGSGAYSWVTDAVDDADNDPTNEIELPVGGTNGQVLKSDGAGGSTWSSDIEATSVKIASLPAFNVTTNGTTYTSVGEKEIGNWNSTLNTDLFNDGNHLNITNGRFTAPVDGLYFFAAQIRVDGIDQPSNSNYSRIMIVKNGNKQGFRNGLHSIRNANAGTAYDTQHVSGILKLTAGDYVSVLIEVTGDADFGVQTESGFNGYLVNKM